MPGERRVHRRTVEKDFSAHVGDGDLAESELRDAPGAGAGPASDAGTGLGRSVGRGQAVSRAKLAADAQATVAAGVDFKLGGDGRSIGAQNSGFNDGRRV